MNQDHIQKKAIVQDSRIAIFIYSIQAFHIESDWFYMKKYIDQYMKNYIDQQPIQNQEFSIPGFLY